MIPSRNIYERAVYNLIHNEYSGEYHVLKTDEDHLLCGRENQKNIHLGERKFMQNLNENDVRLRAAEAQNNQQHICGDCIRQLYHIPKNL